MFKHVIGIGLTSLCCAVVPVKSLFAENLLEEIVVTATRTEKLVASNPYSVSVISEARLAFEPADQVANLLRDLPGVYVSDAGQAGQQRLRIRGEEARRMAMLIDGQEFGDHREVGVPLLIDPAEISRIELVRGPASVLYGPKAMGGVVNIITRQPGDKLFSANMNTAWDSATNGVRIGGFLSGTNEHFDWRAGLTRNRQQDREAPGETVPNTSYESDGLSLSIGRVTGSADYRLNYEQFNSSSEVFVEPEVRFTPPFVDFALDVPRRDRNKVSVSYRYLPDLVLVDQIKLDAYRQTSNRTFLSFPSLLLAPGLLSETVIDTRSELVSDGANFQINLSPSVSNELIVGSQYVTDVVDQTRTRENRLNSNLSSTERVVDRARQHTLAFYVQDDIALNEKLSLLIGARYYRVNGELERSDRFTALPDYDDSALIKSIAVTYAGGDGIVWRANYSDGYIYPSLLNLTVGAFAGSRYINPSATLDPETSQTFELGLRINREPLGFDLTLFHTAAEDYVDHVFCNAADNCPGRRDKIYQNVGQADTQGIELALSYTLATTTFYSNLTWLKRVNEFDQYRTDKSGIPAISGTVGWQMEDHWRQTPVAIELFTRFASGATEKSTTLIDDNNSGWVTLNAAVNVIPSKRLKTSIRLTNLLDKKYHPSTENLLAPGRSIQLVLQASLN